MAVYRFGRWRYQVKPALLRKPLSAAYHALFKYVQVLTGIKLPCEMTLGSGFIIEHASGIVVSGFARFGGNCRIRNGVVIGLARVEESCAPQLGNSVDVGVGAKLLGNIRIGNHVRIGANAVVISDVPDNCIAVGVRAVIKPRKHADGNTP